MVIISVCGRTLRAAHVDFSAIERKFIAHTHLIRTSSTINIKEMLINIK